MPSKQESNKKVSTSLNDPKNVSIKPTSSSRTVSTSKDEEKKKKTVVTTPLKRSSSTMKPSPIRTTILKSNASTSSPSSRTTLRLSSEKRTEPMKTKISKLLPKSNTVPTKSSLSKPNSVMTTIHNVTVCSPPSKRKEIPDVAIFEREKTAFSNKNKSEKSRETVKQQHREEDPKVVTKQPKNQIPIPIREPVAFEVVFDEDQNPPRINKSQISNDSGPEYDDDFESYESDFETGSSSAEVISETTSPSETSQLEHPNSSHTSNDNSESEPDVHSDEDEESELTQFPITVIHRDKEQERKLDSGNYDLLLKKRRPIESFDSLDTLANCEQLDSGISYEHGIPVTSFEPISMVFGGYADFYTRPRITKRGTQLMSKIQLDVITFVLLDLKPIPYDTFMRMFGNSNSMQSATQTQEDRMEDECQTDDCELRSVWTQHPPQYDLMTIKGSTGVPNCTGELLVADGLTRDSQGLDPFDTTIRTLSNNRTAKSLLLSREKPINFGRLNVFLHNASDLISRILSSNMADFRLKTTDLPALSKGFYTLNTRLLNALKIIRVFANSKHNLVLTVHESIDNVYRNDFSNLIMVWNSGDVKNPMRLLSTWSEVCRAEICNECPDIIVCGLRDGSVAMWDLRETYSFCSKLDGYLSHFAATHSITPTWGGADIQAFDLGAVVDVRSFRASPKAVTNVETFRNIQFASLNETGILVIWTLVETGGRNYETHKGSESKFEYNSPWARVKLIQSAVCDLREYVELGSLRPKSSFERAKTNFQMEIFEDEVLKELAETKIHMRHGLQGLRFINLDCGTELIYIGTNRNFIISCSKTLKRERFRKINIIDSGFLFPTAIKLLPNEDYLAVGLSNGSVTLLNCNQEAVNRLKQVTDQPPRQDTPQLKSNDFDLEIGKSCAIQNIIRNERLTSGKRFAEHDFRPTTAILIEATAENGKKPFEQRVFDEEVLLNGSVLRKNLVQTLEVSSDGWTLFARSDGDVRAYDFYSDKEVAFSNGSTSNGKVKDIVVNRGERDEKKLILLNINNDVEVHLLK